MSRDTPRESFFASRRRVLGAVSSAVVVGVAGCSGDGDDGPIDSGTPTATGTDTETPSGTGMPTETSPGTGTPTGTSSGTGTPTETPPGTETPTGTSSGTGTPTGTTTPTGTPEQAFDPEAWYRPVDQPVFTTEHGNNHDPILFVDTDLEYPYKLIVGHEPSGADLWRTDVFSWSSQVWELVSDEYQIAGNYEYDDGIKVDDTYYIYEKGTVLTYTGSLEDADGNWEQAGSFPDEQCDDIGVYYEDGTFHIFGEHGTFPGGFDGSELSHFRSRTGVGDWTLVDEKAIDPNPGDEVVYGVGDPNVIKESGTYYLFCDRETEDSPYKVVGYRSDSLDGPWDALGPVITPRREQTDDWDNHRIQDASIAYVPYVDRYVAICNMKDTDGDPGQGEMSGNTESLDGNNTRVVGTFFNGQPE